MRILTVIINHHFNFCVSKSLYYSTDDALLQNAFTDILNCCDIHFTYILLSFGPISYTKNFETKLFSKKLIEVDFKFNFRQRNQKNFMH